MRLLVFLWIFVPGHMYTGVAAHRRANKIAYIVQVKVSANESLDYGEFPIYLEEYSKIFIEFKASNKTQVVIPKECYVSGYRHRNHHSSLGYRLINEHCTTRSHAYYLPTKDKAVRFRFIIRQFFGEANLFLYLHCTITTCRRNDVLPSNAFRCHRRKREIVQGYCPHKKEENITAGPFVVWPEWLKRDPKSLGTPSRVHAEKPTSNTTCAVQVRVFTSSSFTAEYGEIPIRVESHRKVFIELKATETTRIAFPEECHLSKFKNGSHGRPAMRRQLIQEGCEVQFDLYFLPTRNKAVRFRFVIQQFFGKIGQFLYLHCKITTCQRRDAPQPTVFNCHTHGEHCPKRKHVKIATGPFVVLPMGLRRSGESLKTTTTRPKFFFPTAVKSVAQQNTKDPEGKNAKTVSLDFLVAGLAAVGIFAFGKAMTMIFVHFCGKRVIKRTKIDQEECANVELI